MLVGVVQVVAGYVGLFAVGAGLEDGPVVLEGLLALAADVVAVACGYERAAFELDSGGGDGYGVFVGLRGLIEVAQAVEALAESVPGEIDVGGREEAGL